jgi:Spy/CpxP family protein refolding chaperone
MKINLFAAAAFAVALAMPLAVGAQQGQPPAAQAAGTPSQARIQHRWMRRFANLNLSGDQQQRIQSIINDYSRAHPEGSPRDRQANRELRRQLMGVLTSDQQNQFRQQMRARRAQMQQRREQMEQGSPDQQYQQGAPSQQYQQGPPDQTHQQGPPDQQPAPGQGPPGPPAA